MEKIDRSGLSQLVEATKRLVDRRPIAERPLPAPPPTAQPNQQVSQQPKR